MTATLPSSCRGFGRTYHSTFHNFDMKNDLIRRALSDIPAATPEQRAVFERQEAVRRHYNMWRVAAGRIYNKLSRRLSTQLKKGGITQEQFWAADDALYDKYQRICTTAEVMRDARIAEINTEVHS